jgi:hypothetical protein
VTIFSGRDFPSVENEAGTVVLTFLPSLTILATVLLESTAATSVLEVTLFKGVLGHSLPRLTYISTDYKLSRVLLL